MTPRLIRGGHRRDGKSPCPEPCTAPCWSLTFLDRLSLTEVSRAAVERHKGRVESGGVLGSDPEWPGGGAARPALPSPAGAGWPVAPAPPWPCPPPWGRGWPGRPAPGRRARPGGTGGTGPPGEPRPLMNLPATKPMPEWTKRLTRGTRVDLARVMENR